MYKSLNIIFEFSSVQSLQVDDVIHIFWPAVFCGRCGSQGFAWWHYDVTEWIIGPDYDHVVLHLTVVLCVCVSLASF